MIGGITGYNQNLFSTLSDETLESRKAQQFSALDADGNGVVSKDELQLLMDEFTEKTGFVVDADEVFISLDTDGDESLSQVEIENTALMKPPPPPPPMTGLSEEDAVDPFDTNGDGIVNALDFMNDSEDDGAAKPTFAEIDTDGDGLISKSEFEVFAESVAEMTGIAINIDASFDAADTDGDGYLTEDDMAVFMPPSSSGTGAGSDITDEQVNAVIGSLDTNGNGVIDRSELKLVLLQVKLQAYNTMLGQSDDSGSNLLDLLG